jgi:glycosyltransferase involved in cell wall biosynthesis
LFPHTKLVVSGEANFDTAYVRCLSALRGERVVFTGCVEGQVKESLLSNALAFVAPYQSEGMPIAVLEAMQAGLPVIASDIPAHRELLGHDADALFFDRVSTTSLATTLKNFSTLDNQRTFLMGQSAKRAVQDYTWDKTVDQLEALYERVLVGSG